MIKFLWLLTLLLMTSVVSANSAELFVEDFEGGLSPDRWTVVTGTTMPFLKNVSEFDEYSVGADGILSLRLEEYGFPPLPCDPEQVECDDISFFDERQSFPCDNFMGECYSVAGCVKSVAEYGYGTYEFVVGVPMLNHYSGVVAGSGSLYDESTKNEIKFFEFVKNGIRTNVIIEGRENPIYLSYEEVGIASGDWVSIRVVYESKSVKWYVNDSLIRTYVNKKLPVLSGKIAVSVWQGNNDTMGEYFQFGFMVFEVDSISFEPSKIKLRGGKK